MKATVVVFLIVLLGLGAALLVHQQGVDEQLSVARAEALRWSNRWDEVRVKLEEREKNTAQLLADVARGGQQLAAASNDLAKATAELAGANAQLGKAQADLAKVQNDFESAQKEFRTQEKAASDLQAQNADLKSQLTALRASLEKLESQAAENKATLTTTGANRQALQRQLDELTEKLKAARSEALQWSNRWDEARSRLEAQAAAVTKKPQPSSESDRLALQTQLRRLEAEKARLLAQWNDLTAVQAQYVRLKDQADRNRRLERLRSGAYGWGEKRGAELLVEGFGDFREPAKPLNPPANQ